MGLLQTNCGGRHLDDSSPLLATVIFYGRVWPVCRAIRTFISPVGFSSDVIPDGWRLFYSLNPSLALSMGSAGLFAARIAVFLAGFCPLGVNCHPLPRHLVFSQDGKDFCRCDLMLVDVRL
jgi:hypothetical protein